MTLGGDNLYQIGAALAQALWSGLWIGTAIALAVFFFTRVQRDLNAASRHAAWYVTLAVIASLPVVSFAASLSRAHVDVQPPAFAAITQSSTATTMSANAGTAQSGLPLPLRTSQPTAPAIPPLDLEVAGIALAIVLAGVAIGRVSVLYCGLLGLARVKRASRVVDPSISPALARTMARDANARAIAVRLSDTIDAPAAAGFRSPAILLPVDLVETLEPESLDQIAMHEYAHLRRYDDWTNLVQRFVERLYWFNPVVWFVGGRIDLEREIACDDWAVAGTESVTAYADCLWHLARDGRLPSFAATAPGAFLTRSQVAARIEHLLQQRRDGAPTLRTARIAALAPVLAGALALVIGQAPAIALHAAAPTPSYAATNLQALGLAADSSITNVAIDLARPTLTCPNAKKSNDTNSSLALLPAPKPAPDVALPGTHVLVFAITKSVAISRTIAAHEAVIEQRVAARIAKSVIDRRVNIIAIKAQAVKAASSAVARTAFIAKGQAAARAALANKAAAASATAAGGAGSAAASSDANPAPIKHIHTTWHEMSHEVSHTMRHTTFVEAAADETDNMSFGPNDRDLIAHCSGCDLSNKDLHNADLHGLTLTGDDLSGADLSGADLRGTVLTGVDLSNANLDHADLRGAAFTGDDISGTTFDGAKTDGIKLVGMQLTDAILAGASARSIIDSCAGCDLSGLDLHGRDLHGITLDGADLHGTDLSGANLENARFNGVDFSGVKFAGADLKGAEFNGCDLTNVDLSRAQTDGIEIQGSSIS